jgi:SprT-like family
VADANGGPGVTCHRCGHFNVCPPQALGAPASGAPSPSPAASSLRWAWILIGTSVVVFALFTSWNAIGSWVVVPPQPVPASPAEARQQALLTQNIDLPGDPDLIRAFAAINIRHFGGALPAIPVRWEPGLADVGALASHTFTLEGMFGRIGQKLVILLNPTVREDRRSFDRALCHEVAHLYLFTTGDRTTNHGPAFRTVLERLSKEGAFEGIAATNAEKMALRAWLDDEAARLELNRQHMDVTGRQIVRERAELDRDVDALNARLAPGHAGGRPTAAEVQAIEERRDRFDELVAAANLEIERGRAALAHFNDEVTRYNLMMAYPDGIDEESLPAAGRAMAGASGR